MILEHGEFRVQLDKEDNMVKRVALVQLDQRDQLEHEEYVD